MRRFSRLDKPSPAHPAPTPTTARAPLSEFRKPRRRTLRWCRALRHGLRREGPPPRPAARSAGVPVSTRSRPAADRRIALLGAAPRWCPARRPGSDRQARGARRRRLELTFRLADPDVASDAKEFQKLSKALGELTGVVEQYARYKACEEELVGEADGQGHERRRRDGGDGP